MAPTYKSIIVTEKPKRVQSSNKPLGTMNGFVRGPNLINTSMHTCIIVKTLWRIYEYSKEKQKLQVFLGDIFLGKQVEFMKSI